MLGGNALETSVKLCKFSRELLYPVQLCWLRARILE